MALPANTELMFGGRPDAPKLSAADVSQRFDALMKAVSNVGTRTLDRQDIVEYFARGQHIDFDNDGPKTAYGVLEKALSAPDISKGMTPDALASVRAALASMKDTQPELVKDLTLTNPVSTGLVAFDLEAPSFCRAAA